MEDTREARVSSVLDMVVSLSPMGLLSSQSIDAALRTPLAARLARPLEQHDAQRHR